MSSSNRHLNVICIRLFSDYGSFVSISPLALFGSSLQFFSAEDCTRKYYDNI